MVPIETKEKSENAIKVAYELAQIHQSEIILFHVIRTKVLDAIEDISELEREEQRKQLEEDSYKMLIHIKKSAPDSRMKVFIDIVQANPHRKLPRWQRKTR